MVVIATILTYFLSVGLCLYAIRKAPNSFVDDFDRDFIKNSTFIPVFNTLTLVMGYLIFLLNKVGRKSKWLVDKVMKEK